MSVIPRSAHVVRRVTVLTSFAGGRLSAGGKAVVRMARCNGSLIATDSLEPELIMTSQRRRSAWTPSILALLASVCPVVASHAQPSANPLLPGPKPGAVPSLRSFVGEYDRNGGVVFVIEDSGKLVLLDTARATASRTALTPASLKQLHLTKRSVGPAEGVNQLKVTPVRSIADIRREALAASPPAEKPAARASDLVELTALDPTIKLEIRYATTNNFAGTKFYDQPRAFMQRPAAEAVVRAHRALRALGYGLLIHDAYRPWYVTRMFWDAMPDDKRWLVANPAEGSKHNRGAAVDLTLYDRKTGRPIEMPSTYDESTGRAHADYPGGTALQRWHRALLRNALVGEGFLVNPLEWWHFDYGNWRDYAIGNVTFDNIGR
jgi:zinc D-Ala-D-Ala dipeptidase